MITEDYVSFEVAKLLKEKGFDTPCDRWYSEYTPQYYGNKKHICIEFDKHNRHENNYEFICYVPTLQMAMKWLREVHHIFITIEVKGCSRKEDFIYFKWSIAKYNTDMIDRIDNNLTSPQDYWIAPLEEKETYERTCEAAIKYCLENLI